jgi:hypothetical protein
MAAGASFFKELLSLVGVFRGAADFRKNHEREQQQCDCPSGEAARVVR